MHTGTVESRWETSLRLLGQSWRWLRAHPRLLALPAMATVALAAAATAIYLPLFCARSTTSTGGSRSGSRPGRSSSR